MIDKKKITYIQGTHDDLMYVYITKWILIGTDSHLTCLKLPLQCQEHPGNATSAPSDSH
jgi:hypothetical protein